MMVNETTDARGLDTCNFLVGILHPEIDPYSIIDCLYGSCEEKL